MGWVLIAFSPTVIVMSFGRLLTGNVKNNFFVMILPAYLSDNTLNFVSCFYTFFTLFEISVGVAVGGFILSTSIYLAEITEQRIRGMLMSTTVIALGSGMLAT